MGSGNGKINHVLDKGAEEKSTLAKVATVAKYVTAIFVLIAMLFSVAKYLDSYVAHADDIEILKAKDSELVIAMNKIAKRLDIKIANDKLNRIQERIWRLEDRIAAKGETPETREQMRILKQEYREAERQIRRLENN